MFVTHSTSPLLTLHLKTDENLCDDISSGTKSSLHRICVLFNVHKDKHSTGDPVYTDDSLTVTGAGFEVIVFE